MEVGIFIAMIGAVLCILIDGWAMLRVWRAYQEALKKEETCGMFGETIEPYIRTMQITAICLFVCNILCIIFRQMK